MHVQSVPQGVHAQSNVHPRAVREEGSKSSLNKEAKDQDPVPVGQKLRINQRQVGTITVQMKCPLISCP